MDPQQARVLALSHAVSLAVAGTYAADILADAAKYAEFLLGRVCAEVSPPEDTRHKGQEPAADSA